MKSDNYIVIQGFMINELNLKGNDLLVYAVIYQFSQDGESRFNGSLQYLADWCNSTKHGVMKNLKNLLERGLIAKDEIVTNGVKFVTYRVTELHTGQQSYINNISNNNTNNQQELFTDNTNNINKEELEVRKREELGKKFVADYNSICVSLPKCQRITPKRSKGIANLLKKYSYDDILTVFEKLEASDFCTGKKNGWRADIDFILREDKFLSVLEGKYDNRTCGCSVETISRGEKYRVSKEEKEEMRKAVERGELKEY